MATSARRARSAADRQAPRLAPLRNPANNGDENRHAKTNCRGCRSEIQQITGTRTGMRKLTAAVVMWSLALLTLAVWPADSQQRPPRQQNGGGGSVRPPAKHTGSQPIPPAPTPPPGSGAQQPPATTPPAASPPATSPPVPSQPVTCSGGNGTHSEGR